MKKSSMGGGGGVGGDKYEELSLENFIDASQKHFCKMPREDYGVMFSLGSRPGPSCQKQEHVPDLKVFYVRFLKRY